MSPKGARKIWRFAVNIGKVLLVVGIVVLAAAGVHWPPWVFCAVEAFLNFAAGALLWAGGI
jgi:hypothetical protein